MSTRSTIWLGQSHGKTVHFYWELAEREIEGTRMTGAPIYIAIDDGDVEKETAIRLPKDIAIRLLIALSRNFADEVKLVI